MLPAIVPIRVDHISEIAQPTIFGRMLLCLGCIVLLRHEQSTLQTLSFPWPCFGPLRNPFGEWLL